MIRGFNIVLTVTCLLALGGVYLLKYSTVDTANEKLTIERKIERQRGDLSILKADWALLNQPGHIEPIVRRHATKLGLEFITPEQFVTIEDLPMRTASNVDAAALSALLEALESGVDPIAALIEVSDQ